MFTVSKTIHSTVHAVSRNTLFGSVRKFGNENIWGVAAIDLLHNDFNKIQELKNDQFQLPFVTTEIPPPFCPRCCNYVKNKCLFSPFNDISVDDFDLAENHNLTIRCPVFGEIDNNNGDN